MFDIHTHIIYGIDDGSRSIEESIRLIEMDIQQGVTDIIATPHYYADRPSDPDEIMNRLEKLKQRMEKQDGGTGIRLYPGNETLWFESMPEHLRAGHILTLAGSRFILVEFYPEESWETILRAVRKLRDAGFRPVIAHAERLAALRIRVKSGQDRLSELISQGAYIQLNTGAFSRGILDSTARFCRAAVINDKVHFLGSDMHRLNFRTPEWSAAERWVRGKAERPVALLQQNAKRIVADEDFVLI